jgi:hypothetical protein
MENPFLDCFDFTTKTACVTGASSGIGRAAATLLAGLGAATPAPMSPVRLLSSMVVGCCRKSNVD